LLISVDADCVAGFDLVGDSGEFVGLASIFALDHQAVAYSGDAAFEGVMRVMQFDEYDCADDDCSNGNGYADDFSGAGADAELGAVGVTSGWAGRRADK
jgi:hypothetical protein